MRLIRELLEACLDDKISVTNLLTKAKTVAVKHNMEDLLDWVGSELEGYDTEQLEKLPDYRLIRARIRKTALDIRYINHPKSEMLTPVLYPISEIEKFASGSAEDLPEIMIGSRLLVYYLSTDRAEYGKILEAVRDRMIKEVSILNPQAANIVNAKRALWKKIIRYAILCAILLIALALFIIFQESPMVKGIAIAIGCLGSLVAIWNALRKKS